MLINSDTYYNQRNLPCIFMNEEYEEIMAFTFQTKHRFLLRSTRPKCYNVQWVNQQSKVRNVSNCILCFRLLPWLYHGSFLFSKHHHKRLKLKFIKDLSTVTEIFIDSVLIFLKNHNWTFKLYFSEPFSNTL